MTAYAPTHFRLLLFIDCYWLFFFVFQVIKNKLKFLLKKFA